MAKVTRLGKGIVRKIHAQVDEIFDRAKIRLLGPNSVRGKAIYIGFQHEHSLPGLFEAGAREERVAPDQDILDSLLRVAENYIEAVRDRAKARVINEIDSLLIESRLKGGMDKEDFSDLLKVKLSDIWGETTNHIHMIVDTEASKTKNVSVLDGIMQANAAMGIGDPYVYFVVVRDGDLCEECKRLHLMEDGKTPRIWKMSELGHSYHKKGEDSPKIGGLHPHCRCTLVTLMPGYGFDKRGMVTYKKLKHNEYDSQQEKMGKSELAKTDFDESKHPRDPETGEFIATDPRWEDDPGEEHEFAKLTEYEVTQQLVSGFRFRVSRGHKISKEHIAEVFRLQGIWPEDPEKQKDILDRIGVVQKTEANPGIETALLLDQLDSESQNDAPQAVPICPHIHDLFKGHKRYPHNASGFYLRYLIHRMENLYGYDTPEKAKELDSRFDRANRETNILAGVRNGTIANQPSVASIKQFILRNPHVVDQLKDHKRRLDKELSGYIVKIEGSEEPHVVLSRGLTEGARKPDSVLASYSDSQADDMGGRIKQWQNFAVPLKNVWGSFDLCPRDTHTFKAGVIQRGPQAEYLVSPHDQKETSQNVEKMIPPGRSYGGKWITGQRTEEEKSRSQQKTKAMQSRLSEIRSRVIRQPKIN